MTVVINKTVKELIKQNSIALCGISKNFDGTNKVAHYLSTTGKKLCLYFADYRCEHCRAFDDLTLHHLISRTNRPYMDNIKFWTLRMNFRNQMILCRRCHRMIEGRDSDYKGAKSISQKFIETTRNELEEFKV